MPMVVSWGVVGDAVVGITPPRLQIPAELLSIVGVGALALRYTLTGFSC